MARSKSSAAETAKVPAPKKPAVKSPGPVMYLGPNIPGGTLSHGQVYTGGLPPAAAEVPGAEALFVPLAQVVEAKRALADPVSALARAYRAVATAQGG